jgi:hypothetical protein
MLFDPSVSEWWRAHTGGVGALAALPGRIASLGDDGAVRCWAPDAADASASATLARALSAGAGAFTHTAALRIFAGTWNVAEKRPDPRSLRAWLGGAAGAGASDVAAFGLHEIEKLGAGSVSASAARELAGLGDTLNANASWWQSALLAALEDASAGGGGWEALAARQLSGMLLLVYARKRLAPHLGAPTTASAACGIMGAFVLRFCFPVCSLSALALTPPPCALLPRHRRGWQQGRRGRARDALPPHGAPPA